MLTCYVTIDIFFNVIITLVHICLFVCMPNRGPCLVRLIPTDKIQDYQLKAFKEMFSIEYMIIGFSLRLSNALL